MEDQKIIFKNIKGNKQGYIKSNLQIMSFSNSFIVILKNCNSRKA